MSPISSRSDMTLRIVAGLRSRPEPRESVRDPTGCPSRMYCSIRSFSRLWARSPSSGTRLSRTIRHPNRAKAGSSLFASIEFSIRPLAAPNPGLTPDRRPLRSSEADGWRTWGLMASLARRPPAARPVAYPFSQSATSRSSTGSTSRSGRAHRAHRRDGGWKVDPGRCARVRTRRTRERRDGPSRRGAGGGRRHLRPGRDALARGGP